LSSVLATLCGLAGLVLVGLAASVLSVMGQVILGRGRMNGSDTLAFLGTSGVFAVSGLSVLLAAVRWSGPRRKSALRLILNAMAAVLGALLVANLFMAMGFK
jgi:hypothetical protein